MVVTNLPSGERNFDTARRELVALALIVVMVVGSLTLWLAVPLGWLWVASKINQSLDPSFGAYVAVAVGIPATMLVLFTLCAGSTRPTGRSPAPRPRRCWRRRRGGAACATHATSAPPPRRSM